MQLVYESPHYHVIEYSDIDGYEVTNKTARVCAYFQGPAAAAFRDDFSKVLAEDPSADNVDEYLGEFDSLMTLPIVAH
ncbi:MAG: DUF3567 family protein [Burkholderiales bacterium]